MSSKQAWAIAIAIFFGGMINYLDRAALSIAAPLVTHDLGMSATQLGLVFSGFFIGYTLCCLPGGLIGDRFGARRVLFFAMLAWSLFCGLTGLVTSFLGLLLVRTIFGMTEAPYLANSAKLLKASFPVEKRAFVYAFSQTGTSIGGAIAGPLLGFLTLWYGWRLSFGIVGSLGVVWAFAWVVMGRRHSVQEAATEKSGEAARPRHSIRYYLADRTFIGITAGYFSFAYLLYFFLSWFPTYLITAQHMTIQKMAIVSAAPWLVGAVGQICGGFWSDRLLKRSGDVVAARKHVAAVGLFGAAGCIALMALPTLQPWQAVALMTAASFMTQITQSTYIGMFMDTVEPARVGTVCGSSQLIANCAGIIAPALTGYIVDWTGGFNNAFAVTGVVAVLGALASAVLPRARQDECAMPKSRTAAIS